MKEEEEIRKRLKVIREEREKWLPTEKHGAIPTIVLLADARINALKWVLGEYEGW